MKLQKDSIVRIEELAKMTPKQLEAYFMENVRYFPDAPLFKYAIRVAGKRLLSDDTMELRRQFERRVSVGDPDGSW